MPQQTPKNATKGNRRVSTEATKPKVDMRKRFKEMFQKRVVFYIVGSVTLFFVLSIFIWQRFVVYQWIEFFDTQYANRNELYNLVQAEIPTHKLKMSEVDENKILAQVKKQPWVLDATVTKHLKGMIGVYIQEKKPIVLALDTQGFPAYYLDENAFSMPFQPNAKFNVPVLRGSLSRFGSKNYKPSGIIQQITRDLALMKPNEYALISELEVQPSGNVNAYTIPANNGQSIFLKLGKGSFIEKIKRFNAFWAQTIQPQPTKRFEYVDLRFDGQIITK